MLDLEKQRMQREMENDQIALVGDFKNIAERFCALVDSADQSDRTTFLFQLYLILPELIRAAVSLPAVSYESDPPENDFISHPRVRMSDSEWTQLYGSLKRKLEPNDIYWIVPECWKSGESLMESLADDIADIHRDLKGGLNEQDTRDMIFEWRCSFYSHWGSHAIGALKAVHELVAEHEMD